MSCLALCGMLMSIIHLKMLNIDWKVKWLVPHSPGLDTFHRRLKMCQTIVKNVVFEVIYQIKYCSEVLKIKN